MAQVPEHVLSWLYKVLHEYKDAQRTYSDAARALSVYPSLRPQTEVYTYENGASSLLLTLAGTLPVTFRGTIYRFPIKLWIPKGYPQEAPIVFVTPGKEMIIRPGQHVDVEGRVYHPYLRDWGRMWDRASTAEFLEFLQQVFAKEPPVISRAQQQQYQRSIGQTHQQPTAGQAAPQLPPKHRIGSPGSSEAPSTEVPPPRPPKPGETAAPQSPQQITYRDVEVEGPPLPPLPHERQPSQQPLDARQQQVGYGSTTQARPQPSTSQLRTYGNGRPPGQPGPPVPPLPDQRRPHQLISQQQRPSFDASPVSPVSPMNGYPERRDAKYVQPSPLPQNVQSQPQHPQAVHPSLQRIQYQLQQPYQQVLLPQQQHIQPQGATRNVPPQQPPPASKQPPPDLLSDPFDIAIPGPSNAGPPVPAPPIPPNPEREHLLHALSNTLVQQAQQKVHQNLSAVAPLQAQQHALRVAQDRLEAEIRQLEQLEKTLASNEAILHRSIQDCDRTISDAKSKPPPPIDEVLIAPNMVANQLWMLCAEEAACREAMYVLQKAVDRGRVSGNDFVRQMRALGRECFLKMVLARKCASGLGLEVAGF